MQTKFHAAAAHFGIDVAADRETLVGWLSANDRNGAYSDEAAAAEGVSVLSSVDCWMIILDLYADR